MGVALGDLWAILGSPWRYDAYMFGLGGAVLDLVLARYRILEGQEGRGYPRESFPAERPGPTERLWARVRLPLELGGLEGLKL